MIRKNYLICPSNRSVQYVVMAFILSGFIVFGKYFIRFWAGDGYGDAYTIALLFLVPLTIPLIQTLALLFCKHVIKCASVPKYMLL